MIEHLSSTVHACLDWTRGKDPRPVLDPEGLLFLLTAHLDAGAHDTGDWSVADVHDIARTVRDWDRVPEGLRETWLTWCDFLVDQGRLRSAQSPRRLRSAIAAVDLSPGGPPREADEVGAPALSVLDRLGLFEGAAALPPIVPAEAGELDAAARRCPPLADAARLAEWVGRGRPLCQECVERDELPPQETAEAAEALGVTPERVPVLLAVARGGGLLRTTYTRVLPGEATRAWLEHAPGAAADAWADALPTMAAPHTGAAFLLLTDMFVCGEARTPARLAEACGTGDRLSGGAGGRPEQRTRRVLEVLDGLGAVRRTEGAGFRVSRLGDHFVLRQLRYSGVAVELTPPVSGMDAERVLGVVERGRPVDTERLLERWMAARDTRGAVRDLFEASDAPHAWRRRARVARVLAELDRDLDAVLRLYVHHPVLGGWALGLRDAPAAPSTTHQAVWAVLDRYAILLEEGGSLPEEDRYRYAGHEERFARAVWLTGHPVADTVVDLLAEGALGASMAGAARRVRPSPDRP